jgi:hypothetical protein
MFNWKNYASDAAQSLQWAQDALLKITFFGVVRPDPTLGTIVNLDRYYLGNTVFSSTPNSELACGVTVDDISKQQKVYMPNTIPGLYRTDITMALEYGNNHIYPSTTSDYGTRLYKAYKYTSSPRRYQFAYCTDWDYANNIMTFISYDESGNAIEKWTLDYTTYGSNVWTTTPISSGSTYTAGTGISIDANDVISVTGMATEVELQSVSASIPTLPEEISLVAGQNISIAVTGASAVISSTGGGSSQQVQADWDETDTSDPAYIQNKPTEKNLVAGANVTITEDNDDVIVETTEIASGLQLVAGPGVTMTVSGTNLVVSANSGMDETLLWSGTYSGSISDSNYITLSEDPTNFEYVMVSNGGGYGSTYTYLGKATTWSFFQPFAKNDSGVTVVYATRYDVNHTNLRVTAKGIASYNVGSSGISGYSNASSMNVGEVQLTKVIGINRISS